MARRNVAEVEDVENLVDEAEETAEEKPAKKAKAKKEPARGELPEGYVTPVGLAKVLTEKGLHTNRDGEVTEVKPQMVYSYLRNSPESDKFPLETIQDSLGKDRQVVKIEAGVAWWERKNERTAARKANAAEKAAKKAERAAAKEAEAEDDESVAEEAE